MGPHNSKSNSQITDVIMTDDSDCLLMRKGSHDLRKGSESSMSDQMGIQKAKSEGGVNKKPIDKEHVTIERIFRISLEESEKFLYLELYHATVMSQEKEIAFRIKDLDEIMLNIMSQPERKSSMLQYLLETYHRAVEMIEKRFKNEYDSSYKQIRKVIANYITLLIYSPENFDMKISRKDILSFLNKYFSETDEEELGFFLMDIYQSTNNDISFLANVFSYIFDVIHANNLDSKPHFFNMEKIRKNMMILTSLFNQCPLSAQAYVQESNFLINSSGKNLQLSSYFGPYLNVAIFEAEINSMRTNLPLNKSQAEMDSLIKVYTNKLNEYLNEFKFFIYSIYAANEVARKGLFDWVYNLIRLNMDRTKMMNFNNQNISSIGFLLNTLNVLLKIFLDEQIYSNLSNSDFIFKVVADIDPLFTLSDKFINFSKFERINQDLIKEIIKNESDSDEYNYKEYNLNTKLFFLTTSLSSLCVKNFDDEVGHISNKLESLHNEGKTNDPLFKDYNSIIRGCTCYLRNAEMNKSLVKLSEISCVFLFCLNNKSYPQISLNRKDKIDYSVFIEDFFNYIDVNDNFALSLLPSFIPLNVLHNSLFTRKHSSDTLANEMTSTKVIVYFAIIYSSKLDLILNPHLRSEIFDILVYFFVINNFERNLKINSICKLLNEDFVRDSFIFSLMRVFIDAERLGTSNQFYEKFSIRHKILFLIENIMKANKTLITAKIVEYANVEKEDCTKMINLLMNDLTFLNDECIERLMEIKVYQDLLDNVEKYNSLDEEAKKFEEKKFKDNDRRIKTELKLFNSSMEFMVMISKICQENFLNLKLGERLANLLNYSLDVFTSQRGLKLKIKNMKEYGFDPKFILVSLVSTYVSFLDYPEFLEFIVKDERSYKYDNFEKVKAIFNRGKIKLDFEVYEKFEKLVSSLKVIEEEMKQKVINYDDAPEDYVDPLTTLLMEDPVELPSSKMIIDRSTIETHLLSDQTDPFNRSKLTREMLIPREDLKEKITEYKLTKQKEKNDNKMIR